jgi:UDP-N-acetylmuramate: L-alanyl-gamma-D-glutamyl-meso-diaminopimelate ligase
MRLHILGICGTFMAGLAQLARELGHSVSGSDANVYPPMSDFLTAAGIPISLGWDPADVDPAVDLVVIGNALSRGNPLVEYVLDKGLPYTSGPAWLAEHVLADRHVLAVAGTHGKTTTSSLLAWLLDATGDEPGFLIGGIPENFRIPARLGHSRYFVVEADEYDSAFFDKRAKFVHYRPRTLVLNNLEFDHADIYPDLGAIETQFHHLVRTVPASGVIVWNGDDASLARVLKRGCWSQTQRFGVSAENDWRLVPAAAAGASTHAVQYRDGPTYALPTTLVGQHNRLNLVAAIAAAHAVGVPPRESSRSAAMFRNVKRRLQNLGTKDGVTVYDDFAHHPTAIAATIAGLRERIGRAPLLAVLEPRSNTMRLGFHQTELANALADADAVYLLAPPSLTWDVNVVCDGLPGRCTIASTVDELLNRLAIDARPDSHVLIMSNGDFGGIHQRLLSRLETAR